MLKKIIENKQYKEAYQMLTGRKFPVLIHLADVLNRYIDIRFKNQIDWLKINALMIIVIKGGIVNLTELSDTMIRPRWTITKLVDDMETDGWIKKGEFPQRPEIHSDKGYPEWTGSDGENSYYFVTRLKKKQWIPSKKMMSMIL